MNKQEILKKKIALALDTSKPENEYLNNMPLLFSKKVKTIKIVKPLTHIENDSGKPRHYTPASQEWYNSIYNYNPNYVKALPVADLALIKLLKSYFSFELKNTVSKTLRGKFIRRMSTKKIFLGKGEIKHSNDKAIVTFYIHNAERLFLDRAITLLDKALYDPARPLTRSIYKNKYKQVKVTYNRILSFKEYWHLIGKNDYYTLWCKKQLAKNLDLRNLVLKNINNVYLVLKKLVIFNLISNKSKNRAFISLCEKLIHVLPDPHFKEVMPIYEEYYTVHLNNLKVKKLLNRKKFSNGFINKLLCLVEEIYGKKVEFNIVKLKKLHLNSDIFTQAVALKIKDRKNKIYNVLESSLNNIDLPDFYRASESLNYLNKKDILLNIIRNDKITSMLRSKVNDPLNTLLSDIFTNAEDIKVKTTEQTAEMASSDDDSGTISLEKHVFTSLKHLSMRGVRIEIKGRATTRLTAARSIFKTKWKGGLKNVDSSFKSLSAILLRGHLKSNIQHTCISTKNRNGAIGVKGWVSSK